MSRSRGNRSGRRTFRSATPPPPRQETLANQRVNKTEEKDTSQQVDNATDSNLVVEELSTALGNDNVLINAQETEDEEPVLSRKRPPSPNAISPAAKKPAIEISGVEIAETSTEETSGENRTIVKTLGKPSAGLLQHNMAAAAKDARSMPPPLIGKSESSASKVLTEEFQKQLGQENSKLRALIIREVRKPGKSKASFCM